MIEIPLTAEEFAEKSRQAQQYGIPMTGTEGTIEKSGVKASYRYAEGVLAVNILEKPFFVSTEFCEEQLRKYVGK